MNQHNLVVGTSPLMLIHALSRAKAGDQVTIIDRAAFHGGSWTTPPLVGLESVECGVHLLENRPGFYAALRRLGVKLEADEICAITWGPRRLRMQAARALFHGLVAVNAARRRQGDRFTRISVSAARSLLNIGTPFAYPSAGCRELHESLTRELANWAITPKMGVEIHQIHVEQDQVRCETSIGSLSFDRVAIGSRAHAPLFIGGRKVELQRESDRLVSLILRGVDPQRRRYSYVELLRDRNLKRLRDITPYCVPALAADEFVLCVQLRTSGEQMLAAAGENAVADHLRELEFLSGEARVSDSAAVAYEYHTVTNTDLRAIERRSSGRITAIPTTDLADGFRLPDKRKSRSDHLRSGTKRS